MEIMIIDENGVEIFNPDLSKGYLVPSQIISPDADPVDNLKKFAWNDDDYINVQKYVIYDPIIVASTDIEELEQALHNTDQQLIAFIEDYLSLKVPTSAPLIQKRRDIRAKLADAKATLYKLNKE